MAPNLRCNNACAQRYRCGPLHPCFLPWSGLDQLNGYMTHLTVALVVLFDVPFVLVDSHNLLRRAFKHV